MRVKGVLHSGAGQTERIGDVGLRRVYLGRFVGRCSMFGVSLITYAVAKGQFVVLEGSAFFRRFSIFHLLWCIWVIDMVLQLMPVGRLLPLGAQKQFGVHYHPGPGEVDRRELAAFVRTSSLRAYKVMALWIGVTVCLGLLHGAGVLGHAEIFLLVVFFYVSDLICVLFWCPFRQFIMKNRCCTTCRIFNWDHLMMFAPFALVRGFFGWSLLAMALCVWGVWEWHFFRHPERFWERSNQVLRCGACTDMLCRGRLRLRR